MTKFFITTLGCKVNRAESDAISNNLRSNNFVEIESKFIPDAEVKVCIINTCTVTGKASMQSRQAVRRAIRNFPNAKVIVTGCYAQTQPEELNKIPGIYKVVGHADKFQIPELVLQKSFSNGDGTPFIDTDPSFGLNEPVEGKKTRAVLKIQDGCNAVCTYCIVPKARGGSRSMLQNRVLDGLFALKKAGYREVVLSGIHLGSYGGDLMPKTTLTDLLLRIEQNCNIDRIRLSSIEPKEITNQIIQLVAKSEKFCRHLHVPLQSGDDTVLKKMARPYDSKFFQQLVIKIHERVPGGAIGTDVLVGFPGETDDLFENTYSLVESLPFSYLHVFPYSPPSKDASQPV